MEAGSIFKKSRQLTGLANVNSIIASGYRAQGKLAEAIGTFRASKGIYAYLGMKTHEAYIEVLIAETYLAMGCHREAEREILKALPSIEEQGMITDAVAAVSILREAVRRRKLDPQVLREVTERLRPKNW
jgi:thioredoxin-like negative regulator of GroEL